MICEWCKEEIMPGTTFFEGETSGAMHRECVPFYLADMARYEFTPELCAELLGMEERRDNTEGYGGRKRRPLF